MQIFFSLLLMRSETCILQKRNYSAQNFLSGPKRKRKKPKGKNWIYLSNEYENLATGQSFMIGDANTWSLFCPTKSLKLNFPSGCLNLFPYISEPLSSSNYP